MQQTYTVPDGPGAIRLDAFLASVSEVKSRERIKDHIREGLVTVNDAIVTKPATNLKPGNIVVIDEQEVVHPHDHIKPTKMQLEVLYEDDACMVIQKPRGISVHPAGTMDEHELTILHGAAWLLKERKLPFSPAETLVHRLDKETTGCILIAKSPKAHLELQKQFADRTIEKKYLALVEGVPKHQQAMINAPIGRDSTDRTKMSVYRAGQPRDAQTTYEVLGSHEGASLLLCTLHTGRTHQIRVHLSSIHHPVLGDPSYTSKTSLELSKKLHINFLCLHAWKLGFVSPAEKKMIHVHSPLPADLASTLDALDLSSLADT